MDENNNGNLEKVFGAVDKVRGVFRIVQTVITIGVCIAFILIGLFLMFAFHSFMFGGVFALIAVIGGIKSVRQIWRAANKDEQTGVPKGAEVVFESTDENAVVQTSYERRNMSSPYYFFTADSNIVGLIVGAMFTAGGTALTVKTFFSLIEDGVSPLLLALLIPLVFVIFGAFILKKEIKTRLKYVREMKEKDRYYHR